MTTSHLPSSSKWQVAMSRDILRPTITHLRFRRSRDLPKLPLSFATPHVTYIYSIFARQKNAILLQINNVCIVVVSSVEGGQIVSYGQANCLSTCLTGQDYCITCDFSSRDSRLASQQSSALTLLSRAEFRGINLSCNLFDKFDGKKNFADKFRCFLVRRNRRFKINTFIARYINIIDKAILFFTMMKFLSVFSTCLYIIK